MALPKDRREIENKRFKIDTTVNIAHILTTIGLITAMFTWGSDVKSMLVRHETQILSMQVDRERTEVLRQSQFGELKADIRSLSSKFDYMLEYRPLPNYQQGKRK